jgi:hypothetical protein
MFGHLPNILIKKYSNAIKHWIRRQQIFAAYVHHHALANLIALAVVLYQAQVFVPAVGGFDGAQKQKLFTPLQLFRNNAFDTREVSNISAKSVSLRNFKKRHTASVFSITYRQPG